MNDKSLGCNAGVISILIVFLLAPFFVSAEDESPEAVTVGDISVTQDAVAISPPVIESIPQLETEKLYPVGFQLAKVTLTLTGNPVDPSVAGMIAYRFSPNTAWQGNVDDDSASVDLPGEATYKLLVTYANEDGYAQKIHVGNDTYHVVKILRPATSSASFNIVVGKAITFKHPGIIKMSIDYAIYRP